MAYIVYFVVLFLSWVLFFEFGCARNNISTIQYLRDPETLESSDGSFKFGFFSLANSTDRYVGIWYKKVRDTLEMIWTANRENPLNDFSGVIKISGDGNLQILDRQNKSIWSSNVTAVVAKNEVNNISSCVAQLRDDANHVLLADATGDNVVWQSFDRTANSLLHHMKLRFEENHTATTPVIASWKNNSNPSTGRFTAGFNRLRSRPEIFVWNGDIPYWRSGPWYGGMFLGVRAMYQYAEDDGFQIDNEPDGTLSLSFSSTTRTVTEHYVLNYDGLLLKRYYIEADGGDWQSLWRSLDITIYGVNYIEKN